MNLTVIKTSLKQMIGIVRLDMKLHGVYPNVENYISKVKYSLPFNGEWAVINGGISEETSHSWELPTQRYAYDFLMIDENANTSVDDSLSLNSFYCYDEEILSPADGVVVEVRDGEADSVITSPRRASCKAKDIRGNYIIIEHAEGEYSTLAHLKAGSIIAGVGDEVVRGQVIGRCGNSGNSSEPHLHFQISTGIDFYEVAGLPIEFININTETIPNYDSLDTRPNELCAIELPYITRGQIVWNESEV